jgi:hypothetical protein
MDLEGCPVTDNAVTAAAEVFEAVDLAVGVVVDDASANEAVDGVLPALPPPPQAESSVVATNVLRPDRTQCMLILTFVTCMSNKTDEESWIVSVYQYLLMSNTAQMER